MSFQGDGESVRMPSKWVVDHMPALWKVLRHRLMAQLPADLIEEVRYSQAEEIICQAIIDLESSVRQPLFGDADGGAIEE